MFHIVVASDATLPGPGNHGMGLQNEATGLSDTAWWLLCEETVGTLCPHKGTSTSADGTANESIQFALLAGLLRI